MSMHSAWSCSRCGTLQNTKFCTECGNARPKDGFESLLTRGSLGAEASGSPLVSRGNASTRSSGAPVTKLPLLGATLEGSFESASRAFVPATKEDSPERSIRQQGDEVVLAMLQSTSSFGEQPPGAPLVRDESKPDMMSGQRVLTIDGLRAVAVAAVVLCAASFRPWLRGGWMGVEVLLVVSGYMVTTSMLREYASRSDLDLAAFWGRRVRRLVPGLYAMVAGVTCFVLLFAPDAAFGLRTGLPGALFFYSNLAQISSGRTYFAALYGSLRPPLLQHLYPLAISEHLYVIWPFIFLTAMHVSSGRRSLVTAATATFGCMSVAAMWAIYHPDIDPTRVLLNPFARHSGLLLGAALAFVCSPFRPVAPKMSLIPDVVGLGGTIGLLWMFFTADPFAASTYRFGFVKVDLFVLAIIGAAVHPASRIVRLLLTWRPLLWLGVRAYHVYLWHWPVVALTRPGLDLPWPNAVILVLRLSLTLGLAHGTYLYVETPLRTGQFWRAFRVAWRESRGSLLFVLSCYLVLFGLMAVGLSRAVRPPGWDQLAPYSGAPAEAAVSGRQQDQQQQQPQEQQLPPGSVMYYGLPPVMRGADESVVPTPAPTPPPPPQLPADQPAPPPVETQQQGAAFPPPPPPPAPAPSPEVPATTNAQVDAFGDTLLWEAQNELRKRLPQVFIDAAVPRQYSQVMASIEARRSAVGLAPVVVLSTGTSDGLGLTSDAFDSLMQALQGVRRLIVVNVRIPETPQGRECTTVNRVIVEGLKQYSNAELVDWWAASDGRTDLFVDGDVTHPTPVGRDLWARLVADQIESDKLA